MKKHKATNEQIINTNQQVEGFKRFILNELNEFKPGGMKGHTEVYENIRGKIKTLRV